VKKKRSVLFTLFLLICGGLALAARATTLARMSVAQMTAAAQVVARVRCVSNATRWESGEIWTITTFDVLDVWKGPAPPQVSVRLLGGRAGHLVSTVPGMPRFVPGAQAVLFLEPTRAGDFSLTSWGQGTFRIRREPSSGREIAVQDAAGATLLNHSPRTSELEDFRRLPIEQLRQKVVAAERTKGSPS
jgi:hypothetical protein